MSTESDDLAVIFVDGYRIRLLPDGRIKVEQLRSGEVIGLYD